MRVVMFGPHVDVMGGISSVVQTWLKSEAIRAVDLTYLSTMREGRQRVKLKEGLSCQASLMADVARRGAADLYHLHVSTDASFWRKLTFFEQVRRLGRPVVVHVHGALMEPFYASSPVTAAAMRHMFRNATRVIALYPGFADVLARWTGGRARTRLLLNPVVLSDFLRPADTPRPARPTVLFMGVLGDRKGTWDLVHVIPRILAEAPNALFRFGGNGEIDRFHALVEELRIGHAVEFLGWVRGDDKLRAFREASVYCLPTYFEALPMSVLEAMAARLPVVTTDVNGIPEAMREGQTGYMIRPGDRDALADRLIRLLRDPAQAEAMGLAGEARAHATFDHEVVVRALIDLWQDAIRHPL